MNCYRCNRPLKAGNMHGLGADCLKVARQEAETFCKETFRMTWDKFFDSCDSEFAGDNDQTVQEYQKENGRTAVNLEFCYNTLWNHGLWGG